MWKSLVLTFVISTYSFLIKDNLNIGLIILISIIISFLSEIKNITEA